MGRCRPATPDIAVTHAGPIKRDNLEAIGQARSQLRPDLQVIRIAVEQHQWWSTAQPRHSQTPALTVHLEGRLKHQPRSSNTCCAARTPEMAQKLTHCPGCVELPARYSPWM